VPYRRSIVLNCPYNSDGRYEGWGGRARERERDDMS